MRRWKWFVDLAPMFLLLVIKIYTFIPGVGLIRLG